MAARIDRTGRVHQIDRPAEPDELVTEEDVKEPSKLARVLLRLLKDVAALKRRYWPRRLDFEDVAIDSNVPVRLAHNFRARVRWWVVDWQPTTPGDVAIFERAATATTTVLVLNAGNNGTASFRVEVA